MKEKRQNNIRIARELVRIAKEIISVNITITNTGNTGKYEYVDGLEGIADKRGDYKNFTGKINWGYDAIKGMVSNASFYMAHGEVVLGKMAHGEVALGKMAHGKMAFGKMAHGKVAFGKGEKTKTGNIIKKAIIQTSGSR